MADNVNYFENHSYTPGHKAYPSAVRAGDGAIAPSQVSSHPHGSGNASEKLTLNLIWQMDDNYLLEREWIVSLFPQFEINSITDQAHEVVVDHAIVVSFGKDMNNISMYDYLQKFKSQGFKVGVIHLGDEWFTSTLDFYELAEFVFRTYYRREAFKYPYVYFMPLGYKRGLHEVIEPKPMRDRPYTWSFAGAIRGKISRRQMLTEARKILGGITYIGEDESRAKELDFEGYGALMSNTVFALSPGGNRCLETFRIYEAIEAGAIPVVEDINRLNILKGIIKELIKPKEFIKHRAWSRKYWRSNFRRLFAPSYWTLVYGTDFPCPRCSNWKKLPDMIQSIDPVVKAKEIQIFWRTYQTGLQQRIRLVTLSTFFPDAEP